MKPDFLRSCILGLAVGDALGVPVEFSHRSELDADPVTTMRGFGTYHKCAGTWSDDTSMTLCALEAKADLTATAENFVRWLSEGAFTTDGDVFDVGGTCSRAIRAYALSRDVTTCGQTGEFSCGTGALMRIIPFALFAPGDYDAVERGAALTHNTPRCRVACGIYAAILWELKQEQSREAVPRGLERARDHYAGNPEWAHFAPLMELENRSRSSISGSGYVVDTLEAALWCLLTTDNDASCVLRAVNLGQDTDTVAAIAGGLAGALYGAAAIPSDWLTTLQNRDLIESLCRSASGV